MSKGKKKRVNPRRVPLTAADLKRAKETAVTKAAEKAWALMFTVLRDKEGMSDEDLVRIANEVWDLAESVAQGYCTVADLRDVLRREAHIRITEG